MLKIGHKRLFVTASEIAHIVLPGCGPSVNNLGFPHHEAVTELTLILGLMHHAVNVWHECKARMLLILAQLSEQPRTLLRNSLACGLDLWAWTMALTFPADGGITDVIVLNRHTPLWDRDVFTENPYTYFGCFCIHLNFFA